jgi:hypothetical protein
VSHHWEAVNGNIKSLLRRGRGYKNLRHLLLKAQPMATTKGNVANVTNGGDSNGIQDTYNLPVHKTIRPAASPGCSIPARSTRVTRPIRATACSTPRRSPTPAAAGSGSWVCV